MTEQLRLLRRSATVARPGRASARRITVSAVVLSALLIAPTQASADLLVAPPDQDPFYSVPVGLGGLANGTVLDSRPVSAMALAVPMPADAWQVKYKTVDQRGTPSAFVTTVLRPTAAWTGPGPRPLVSYQVAIDALSTKCAPSFVIRAGVGAAVTAGPTVLTSNAAAETANILQALQRGYSVAVPDWEGPRADWLGSDGAAHAVLDGLRAVKHFAPAQVDESTPVGLVGYSGGALATNWATQMQPTYAPEMHFVGAALGGAPVSLKASIAAFAANAVGSGSIPLFLAALQRSYPTWNTQDLLSAAGVSAVANSQGDCLTDALARNAGVSPTTYEAVPGAVFNNPLLDGKLGSISPLLYPGQPSTQVLFYHADLDEFAPIAYMRQLAARFCSQGRSVQITTLLGDEHLTHSLLGFPTALDYLTARFTDAGSAPSDCS